MKALLGWLGRTGLLYLLLCAAIAFYLFAWPSLSAQFSGESLRTDAMSVAQIRDRLAQDRRAAQSALEARAEAIRDDSREALDRQLAKRRGERAALTAELGEGGGWLDSVRPSRILERKRLELRLAALDAEIGALEAARDARMRADALASARAALARYARIPTARAVSLSRQACTRAERALATFDAREPVDRGLRNVFLQERAALDEARRERCTAASERATRRQRGLQAASAYRQAKARVVQAEDWSVAALPDPARSVSDTTIRDIAWRAALALLAILLTPFAIRTLFYYALAPIAERRPPIRLAPSGGTGGGPRTTGVSEPSLSVTLGPDEELLVRQSFLQSSPVGAHMRTRWLLSWRRPLSSLASGLAFLTEARGEGAEFTVSARDDPFAEIARIDLPPGGALVVQPRALAAVVQPVDRPLQIRSRWRLFSLHAWLTLQFRYLVFHGPVALIVKGGRGVRVEQAKAGRVFGQDQLIGFSAHTAYSIGRNETFQPYLFGREPLFRDRVVDDGAAADGILVIEEAPMAGQRQGVRAGLENAFDAMLKAFGI
ncbi:hypothetical protein [Aurantiacibacter spongiae]|uniref:Uncharacterized protein n=1 Tax=Aurantiacibacter spongiae TaxID=2488860 RepID=A0A3N5CRM2_9SPHN|nr:hypothetical protein [Aurantiacibacter spongiae]RPF71257.1 hypothetical protein EG799_06270 [Aurantiacibacter spongiae]